MHKHLEEKNNLNSEAKADILMLLGIVFIFATVFLMFREYAFMIVAEQGLIPATVVSFILAIILLGASAVIKRMNK